MRKAGCFPRVAYWNRARGATNYVGMGIILHVEHIKSPLYSSTDHVFSLYGVEDPSKPWNIKGILVVWYSMLQSGGTRVPNTPEYHQYNNVWYAGTPEHLVCSLPYNAPTLDKKCTHVCRT